MLIYAGRIANLTDARYFAARNVQWLGFNLEPGTENYLDPVYMQSMREWVQGPSITGEFTSGDMPVETIVEAARFFQLDGVLIGPNTDFYALGDLNLLLKIDLHHPDYERIIQANSRRFEAIIVDLSPSSDLDAGDLALLQWSVNLAQVVLNSSAEEAVLRRLTDQVGPAGLYFVGGEEERVGVKSFDELETVFDWLEEQG